MLIRALLISGIVIGITMIVGIHPVTGGTSQLFDEGSDRGMLDCHEGKAYNPTQGPGANSQYYQSGYDQGWRQAGCTVPDSSTHKK